MGGRTSLEESLVQSSSLVDMAIDRRNRPLFDRDTHCDGTVAPLHTRRVSAMACN